MTGPIPLHIPGHSGPHGAERLAERIEAYWRKQGFAVHCEPYSTGVTEKGQTKSYWAIRSDTKNGLPVRRAA